MNYKFWPPGISYSLLLLSVVFLAGCEADVSSLPHQSAAQVKRQDPVAVHVSEANFNKVVLQAKHPVLVDFTATWCGPCQQLAPTIEELAQDYEGRATVAKLDVDESSPIAQLYEVNAMPTLMLFMDGKPVWRREGGLSKAGLASVIDRSLALTRGAEKKDAEDANPEGSSTDSDDAGES